MFLGLVPGFPHISLREIYHACPSLLTVFLHHTIGTLNNATCVHTITDLEMLRVTNSEHA